MLALFLAATLATVPDETPRTFTCDLPAVADCSEEAPSRWDLLPACSDYNLDTVLDEASKGGDGSATALLEQRYETVQTYGEQRRIAGMLLHRVPDDSKYWTALNTLVEEGLRFEGDDDATAAKLKAYAAERGTNPDSYLAAAWDALAIVMGDERSRPLLRRALKSDSATLQWLAISGFAMQKDESALEAIDATLQNTKGDRASMVFILTEFRSEAADKIAYKYLDQVGHWSYLETKRQLIENDER